MGKSFEKRTKSKWYWSLKIMADLVIVNFIFTIISILSLFVLFFPGIISLTTTVNKILNGEYYNPFTTFFEQIKEQWSFMWRLEVLGMSIILIFALVAYGYYAYIVNFGYDWVIWLAIIIVAVTALVFLVLFLHLVIFNEYFKNDTFFMMIRKAGVIARKKAWLSFLMILFLLAFAVVFFLLPFLIPFIPFSTLALINLSISKKTYTQLALEEQKREILEGNLFMPVVYKDKSTKRKED